MSEPVFTKRPKKETCQVRFWSTPSLYELFKARVKRDELSISQVFSDFMEWFIGRPQ